MRGSVVNDEPYVVCARRAVGTAWPLTCRWRQVQMHRLFAFPAFRPETHLLLFRNTVRVAL